MAAGWLTACLLLIYGFDIGRGFVTDDFGWVLHSGRAGARDIWASFADPQGGFFRPLVALSFGIDTRLFGPAPAAFALTNLALVLAIAAALAVLAETLGLDRPMAVFAAGVWALNFHGVPGALLWISGRTSLMAALFATLAAIAVLQRRPALGGILTFCSLLSKEEPLMLPVTFAVWSVIDGWIGSRATGPMEQSWPRRASVAASRAAGPSVCAVVAYLALRSHSNAFTPSTAPPSYQLSISPAVLIPNILEYLDRSTTFVAAVLVATVLLFARRMPRLSPTERRIALKGAAWLVLGFGVTIMIPARSSLYVCFPAIGSALAGAAVCSSIWRTVPPARRRVAVVAALLLPIGLLPVYRARNRRLKDDAVLATRALAEIGPALSPTHRVRGVVVFDDPEAEPSMASAFGNLLPDAIEVTQGTRVRAEVVPHPPTPADRAAGAPPGVVRFELRDGDLRLF